MATGSPTIPLVKGMMAGYFSLNLLLKKIAKSEKLRLLKANTNDLQVCGL